MYFGICYLEFVISHFIFIPNSPYAAVKARTIFKDSICVLLHGFRGATGAYGHDGEDFCSETKGSYRGRIAGV